MRMMLKLFVVIAALGAFAARAADEKPKPTEEKPGQLERSVTKAGKAMERTGDRAAKATVNGLDRAGKAAGRTAEKTTDWVKKKTE